MAQSPDAQQLVQQGIARYQAGDFKAAIAPWQAALNIYQKMNNPTNVAIVNENLARAYQQMGKSQEALTQWELLRAYYHFSGNLQQLGRILTEEAQIYSNLGQPGKAIALLCGDIKSTKEPVCLETSALHIARKQQDHRGEVAALGSLGEAYRLSGKYDESIKYLEQAQQINELTYQSRVLNNLGKAYVGKAQLENIRADSAEKLGIPKASEFNQKALSYDNKAREFFQMSLQLAQKQDDKPVQMQTLLNLIQLDSRSQANVAKNTAKTDVNSADPYIKSTDINVISVSPSFQSNVLVQQALSLLNQLPNSPNKVYTTIDLANLAVSSVNMTSPLISCDSKRRLPDSQVKELLLDAVKTSQSLEDARSESFATGVLGHFYECSQEYKQALELTNKALLAADQKLKSQDSVYLWEWQAGRIYQAQGKQEEAISAYDRAYTTLEKIRSDILIADRDLQFDFRDIIQPLYRDLAQLKLELASSTSINSQKRNKELTGALKTIDSLKLAELQNFFGNDCILTSINEKSVDELLGNNTAVFNSIILQKGIAILLTLPNGEQKFDWFKQNSGSIIDPASVIQDIKKFREGVVHAAVESNDYDLSLAGKLYNLIIRPFEKDLNSKQIKTLVFVQDGILRTVPMAALYDNISKQFLVEKYAIATSPSLSLTVPKKLNPEKTRALILGLTKQAKVDDKVYDILTNVPSEIKAVQSEFPKNKLLQDQALNLQTLEKELNQTDYSIIHIATHAQFGIIPEDTFIVTGNNSKITINQLGNALRKVNGGSNTVELLALTACETALGDDRATLGLAGVALQSGVKSTFASLWSVSDESTSNFVAEFYANLKSGMSKAEALRTTQEKFIHAKKIPGRMHPEYDNPAYWAPFILIGNWL